MGFDDKVDNKGEELKGRAKEAAGAVTGDDELKNEGRADQAESSVKQAGAPFPARRAARTPTVTKVL